MTKLYDRLCEDCRTQKATHHLYSRRKLSGQTFVLDLHQCVACVNETLKKLVASGLGELDVDLELNSVE